MGYVVILAFISLFVAGFPVVYAVLIPAVVYVVLGGFPLDLLAQRVTYALDSFPLIAVPIFIFVGNLMNTAGITDRIFRFADAAVGRVPGGLAQVNIFSSLIFSGMSGAALADVGGLGRIEIRAMRERGFAAPYAASITAASAVVGPIFPPSIPLIVYGSVTSVSIIQLLLAGIVPALICVGFLMATAAVLALRHNHPRSAGWPSPAMVISAMLPALPALFAPVLLVAGMLLGLFTPTEAASVTAIYVLFIGIVIYREMTWQHIIVAAMNTVRNTSAILVIVAAAMLFGWILAIEQIPQDFARLVLGITSEPWALLLLVNLMMLIAGMFLDSTTATLLIVPIVAPPVVAAGVDPVHLGIVVIFNLMIGLLTPPMGLSLFLIADIAGIQMRALLRALLPFYLPLIGTLLMITYVEDVTLWIPRMLR